MRLVWLAVRRSKAQLSAVPSVDEHELYRDELGEEALLRFAGELAEIPDLKLLPGSGSTRSTTCTCRCTRGSG